MNVFMVAPQLDDDPGTEITVKWAIQLKESMSDLDKIQLIPFFGKKAVRAQVEPALKKDMENKGIFAFIDHGERDKLIGADDKALIDNENIGLLKNKFIYAVACKSASNLGRKALKSNVAGYIGFTESFHIVPTASNTFGHCFLSGLRAIIIGRTSALEAMEKVKTEIRRVIHELKTHKRIHLITRNRVIASLVHNINCMVCLGNSNWRI